MLRRAVQSLFTAAPKPTPKPIPAHLRSSIPSDFSSRKFQLELGDMERGLVDLSVRCSAASLISVRVDLEQAVDVQQVRAALGRMTELYPLLRCQVALAADNRYVLEHDPKAEIPVTVHDDDDHASLFASKLQRTQLELNANPHRVVVLPSTNSIVFNLEHFVVDGSSLTHFLDRFLQAYAGVLPAALAPEPWLAPSCVAIRSTLALDPQALRGKMVWEAVQMLQTNMASNHGRLPRTSFSKQFTDREMPHLSETLALEHTLSADSFARFKRACRANGCTVTTAVVEAYSRAFGERIQQKTSGPMSISSVVVTDVRHLLTKNRPHVSAMSPYLGASQFVSDELQSWKAFGKPWELARGAGKVLTSHQTESTLVRTLLNTQLTSYLPTSKMLPTFTISSWGATSPLRDDYPNQVGVRNLRVLQNYNFFMAPCLSVYPCGAGRLRIAMFATVPYHHQDDLQWVSHRAGEILERMTSQE